MKARHNPFASRYINNLPYRHPDLSLTDIMQRLGALQYRAAIAGPEGSGKTTLLEQIGRRLRQAGYTVTYLRLDGSTNRFSKTELNRLYMHLSSTHAVLLDGAEQMSWAYWRYFRMRIHRAGALVITTHTPGYLPVLVRTRTSAELLFDLVAELLGPNRTIPITDIKQLFDAANGNIRTALRELYDRWADA